MGVTGLWGILEPTGKPVKIQSLRGKVLSVDVSIWLHQSVKGFRDKEGNPLPNAHLLGVFHRVCKLLSHGIKPVFVFDGGVPALKKQTMNLRKKRKIEALDKSESSRSKLLTNLLKQQLQRQYGGLGIGPSDVEMEEEVEKILAAAREKNGGSSSMSMRKRPVNAKSKDNHNNSSNSSTPSPSPSKRARKTPFSPCKKSTGKDDNNDQTGDFGEDFEKFREKLTENFNIFSVFLNKLDNSTETDSEEDEDDEDEKPRASAYRFERSYDDDQQFNAIISPTFDELPLEMQHDMLFDMQESRKQNSWGKIDLMPKEAQSFSSFQMERLKKRATLQKKIQSVQKEMGNRHIHLSNFDELMSSSMFKQEEEDEEKHPELTTTKVSSTPSSGPIKHEKLIVSHGHNLNQGKSMIYLKSGNNSQQQPTSSSSSSQAKTQGDIQVAGPSSSKQPIIIDGHQINIEDYVIEGEWTSSDEDMEKSVDTKKKKELSEEEQLQQAIKLSLQEESIHQDEDNKVQVSTKGEESPIKTNDDDIMEENTNDKKVEELTEEEQIERAMKLSLENLINRHISITKKQSIVVDLTKDANQVKEKEKTDSIPSDKKSAVPNTTPVTTTIKDNNSADEEILIRSPEESESDNNSDFEEVVETVDPSDTISDSSNLKNNVNSDIVNNSTSTSITTTPNNKPVIQIQLNLNPSQTLDTEEDLFADIFKKEEPEVSQTISGNTNGSKSISPAVVDIMEDSDSESSGMESVKSVAAEVEAEPLEKKETVAIDKDEEKLKESLMEVKDNEDEWEPDFPSDNELEEGNTQEDVKSKPVGEAVATTSNIRAANNNQVLPRTLGLNPNREAPVRMISAQTMQAQEKLNLERRELTSARGNQERIATTITDQMYADAQELLALFGVPYVISPMEAESQCAFLDVACLTDGSITDDSDIWLFGAQRVYKNFFSTGDRQLELYEYADVVRVLNLDREKLVMIAIFTGSDYSDGVEGVGPVRALEILSEFSNSSSICPFDTLVRFREWWEKAQADKKLDAGNKLREAFRKIKLKPGFPSRQVYDAYLDPAIDSSTEPFRWGTPDLDALRSYTRGKFGWDERKCDSNLLPLLKNLRCQADETSRQLTMDRFLTHLDKPSKRKIKSKRLKVAMKKLKKGFGKKNASGDLKLSSSSENSSGSDDSDSDFQSKSEQKQKQKPQRKQQQRATKPQRERVPADEIMEQDEKEDSGISDQELDTLLKNMGVRRERVRRADNVQGFSGDQATASTSTGKTGRKGAKVKLPKKESKSTSAPSSSSSSSTNGMLNSFNERVSQPAPAEIAIPTKSATAPPKKSTIIPQKARAEFQKQANKKRAIELLKKVTENEEKKKKKKDESK